MLQVEKNPGGGSDVAVVHEDRPPPQQVAMALQCEVNRGVQQGMAWAQERGQRLALRCDEVLFEGNALVARQNGFAHTDQAVPVAHWRGNMRDLVATRLTLLDRTA